MIYLTYFLSLVCLLTFKLLRYACLSDLNLLLLQRAFKFGIIYGIYPIFRPKLVAVMILHILYIAGTAMNGEHHAAR